MNRKAKQRQARALSRYLAGYDPDDEIDANAGPDPEENVPPPAPPPPPRITPVAGLRTLEVSEDEASLRLDKFLAARSEAAGEALSRSRIKSLIEDGKVTLDGEGVRDGKTKVRAGQSVSIDVPEAAPAEPEGEDIPLDVVFEDEHLIIIDKPAGLVVHPAAGHDSGTLVNALIAHCGETLSGIGGVKRPGIVHRLDKETTGLLVVAKTDAAHHGLAALFADHGRTMHLVREYQALVWNAPARSHGTVDAPVGRHATSRERQAIVHGERGREAITHWEAWRMLHGADGAPVAAHIACQLETGRTHQIRVHMAHIGHPVMGDPLYASGFKTKARLLSEQSQIALGALKRQALHAARLGFEHPVTGEELEFESPLPADMQVLLDSFPGK